MARRPAPTCRGQQAAFLYSSVQLVKNVANLSRSRAGQFLAAMRWLSLALFIIGLARPQFVDSETSVKASGVDIVVALDLSGSMESEDFQLKGQRVNRLAIAKDVVKAGMRERFDEMRRMGIRTVMITGGTRGLGLELARQAGLAGARVVL